MGATRATGRRRTYLRLSSRPRTQLVHSVLLGKALRCGGLTVVPRTCRYEGLLCHRFNADCSTIAVGGKCMMRECGGLQMPDYYLSQFYADAPKPTHDFAAGWKPDAIFINLGTNDNRVIPRVGADHFVDETLAFMKNATVWYSKPDIDFFLSAGPMENITLNFTQNIVVLAQST